MKLLLADYCHRLNEGAFLEGCGQLYQRTVLHLHVLILEHVSKQYINS
jgi:hypothetical protein